MDFWVLRLIGEVILENVFTQFSCVLGKRGEVCREGFDGGLKSQ